MLEYAIKLNAVSKNYWNHKNHIRALSNIELTVPVGTIIALIGATGSGKSTLIKIINGLLKIDTGEIIVLGENISQCNSRSLRNLRTKIGFICQSVSLVPRLSILENILIGVLPRMSIIPSLLGRFFKEDEKRALKLLETVGLQEIDPTRPAQTLSGGQAQRVAIARALINRPNIILADEPISSLDPKTGKDILRLLIGEAQRKRATVILSLHNPELASQECDKIIGLCEGQILVNKQATMLQSSDLDIIYKKKI